MILTTLIGGPVFCQTNYFVDKLKGNDSNDGKSLNNAWKTIQKAARNATPNSIVYIRAGIYYENIFVEVSGSNKENMIVFRNYNKDTVIMDGTGTSMNSIIEIINQSHIEFRNIIIQNKYKRDGSGVLAYTENEGSMTNLRFINLTIRNIGWTTNPKAVPTSTDNVNVLLVYGSGKTKTSAITEILIDSCNIYNNINGFSENCTINGNVENFTISNNRIHDNTNIGIDIAGNYGASPNPQLDNARYGLIINNNVYNNISPYSTSAGIYIDGGWNNTIERNICTNNHYGIEIGCEENGTTQNIIVKNNLIKDNLITGMHVGGYDPNTTGQVINCVIRNNTFINNDTEKTDHGELIITKLSQCSFENNIFHTNNQNILFYKENIKPSEGISFNYNCWYTPNNDPNSINIQWDGLQYNSFSKYQSAQLQDKNSQYANPNFDATKPIYLKNNSICLEGGNPRTTISPNEKDLFGNDRLIKSIIDIGAVEHDHNTTIVAQSKYEDLIVIPNPCITNCHLKFEIPTAGLYEIKVYNSMGMLSQISQLNSIKSGTQLISLNTSNLVSGFYKLQIQGPSTNLTANLIITSL